MDLQSVPVTVVGLGKSGMAAVRLLCRRGARVTVTDDQPAARLGAAVDDLGRLGVTLRAGGIDGAALRDAGLIVLSPGVPPTLPPIAAARAAGARIIGEIALAARFIAAPIVGVTGTNGKSTVTSLCGAIAAETGRPSFCGGNLGTPLCDVVDTAAAGPGGLVVCELSSFQLESAGPLRPHAATVLNLTPDHLDRYPSFAAYGDAKARIFANMPPAATRVLNADDPEVLALYDRHLGSGVPACLFTTAPELPAHIIRERALRRVGLVQGDELVLRDGTAEERYPLAELHLVGRHNQANALAAFLLLRDAGLATQEQVRAAAARFRALPHRMELVLDHAGLRYYDDSKGTNVDAVVAGLAGFPRRFVLIAGGRDKGGSYAPLAEVLAAGPARGAVLIGEAAPLIEAALGAVGVPTRRAATMDEAVRTATALCQPGDAVVLSPACSSFDMFRDYADRARAFVLASRRAHGLPEAPDAAPGEGGHHG